MPRNLSNLESLWKLQYVSILSLVLSHIIYIYVYIHTYVEILKIVAYFPNLS